MKLFRHFPAFICAVMQNPRPFARPVIVSLAIALASVTISGCGGSIKVTLNSSERLNPDKNGKALSVVVRVYQLSHKDRFEKADFLSLVKADQKLLEKDILSRREITLMPASKDVLKEDRKEGTEYIAVMALFREDDQIWRRVIALKDLWIKSVKFTLNQRTISDD